MKVLHETRYFTITLDGDLVRVTRSAEAFPSVAVVHEESAAMKKAFIGFDASSLTALIDMRAVAMNNNPQFEQAAKEMRGLTHAFRKTAVLVRTAVGQLQVSRLARDEVGVPSMFSDEDEALAFLKAR